MNRLMVAVVDDAAHGIWAGGNKTGKLSATEWVEVEMNTYQLQAAATLVSMGGTGAADHGWVTAPAFQEWSRKLNEAGISARSAVTAKNQVALRVAGDKLVETCNACHKEFKPNLPPGAFSQNRPGFNKKEPRSIGGERNPYLPPVWKNPQKKGGGGL